MTPNRIALALAALLLAGVGLVVVQGVSPPQVAEPRPIPTAPPAPPTPWPAADLTEHDGLESAVLEPGVGTPPVDGQLVVVSWTAWLPDSQRRVESVDHERLVLGETLMMPGLEQVLRDMAPGEHRLLRLPPALAYGQTGRPPTIPRDAELVVEALLHAVHDVRPVPTQPPEAPVTDVDGVATAVLEAGTGEPPPAGESIALHVTLWLEDGTLVSSTLEQHRPAVVRPGRGDLFPGIDRAAASMRIDERRKLVLPPQQAAGPGGRGPIPPDATLIVEIERVPIQ